MYFIAVTIIMIVLPSIRTYRYVLYVAKSNLGLTRT